MTGEINSGDTFEDEHKNPIRVLSVDNGVVRAEYELPTDTFMNKFGSNRTSSPRTELALINRLKEHDESFPAVEKEGFPYESPLRDEVVNEFEVIEPFRLENEFNLHAIDLGLNRQDMRHEPERFPGLLFKIDESWESGFVVLFDDGRGASFSHSESRAQDQVNHVTEKIEELGLL